MGPITIQRKNDKNVWSIVFIAAGVGFLIIVASIIAIVICVLQRKKQRNHNFLNGPVPSVSYVPRKNDNDKNIAVGAEEKEIFFSISSSRLQDSVTEEPAQNIPQESCLALRKISNQVHIESLIGHGKFGRVHKCTYRNETVALKKFFPHAEKSWIWESRLYQTAPLVHENILKWIASDQSCKLIKKQLSKANNKF